MLDPTNKEVVLALNVAQIEEPKGYSLTQQQTLLQADDAPVPKLSASRAPRSWRT